MKSKKSNTKETKDIHQGKFAIEVGQAIKKLRKQNNLSQYEFAECGSVEVICSVKTLGRIERGETNASLRLVSKLLFANGMTLADLEQAMSSKQPYNTKK